ncbi:MAG: PAS domain S-box protein [Alphaproteobacteria bacterium]|nr:PAS domain S-box protein [Alphaproteobacteria bacterium]
MTVGFTLFDADDRFVFCNQRQKELFPAVADLYVAGASFDSIIRASIARGVIASADGREDEWLAERSAMHLASDGTPHELEHADGTWSELREIRLANGSRVSLRTDITDRKQAQEAAKESEAQFRNLIDGSIQGTLIHRNFKPLLVNHAWAEIFGFDSSDQVLAQDSILGNFPEHEQERFKNYAEARSRGEEAPAQFTYEAIRRDGRKIWVNNIVHTINWAGEPAILSMAIDITEKRNIEEALRERERRYRLIFDQAEVCLWDEDFSGVLAEFERLRREGVQDLRAHLLEHPDAVWGLASRINVNQVNEATLRLFGAATQEELLGSLDRILPDAAADLFLDELVAIWEGHEHFRAEVKHRNFAGDDLWVVVTMPIPSRPEDFQSVPISVVDITETKRAEEDLLNHRNHLEDLIEERTNELRTIADSIPVLIARLDRKQRYVFVNKTAERWLDRSADEIIGRTVAEVFGEVAHGTLLPSLDQVLAGQPLTFETRTTYPDGVTRDVEISHVPDIRPDGAVSGVFSVVVDISKLQSSVRDLADREAKLAEAQRIANVGSWEHNFASDRLSWSRQVYRIFGVTPEDFEPSFEQFSQQVHPDDRHPLVESLRRARKTGQPYSFEHRIIRPDGEVRTVLENAEITQNEEGVATGMSGSVQDVTGLRQAEGAARRSEQRYRALIESGTVGIFVFDVEYRPLFASELAVRMFGYHSAAEILALPTLNSLLDEAEVDRIDNIRRRRLAGEDIPAAFELHGRRRDGTPVWLLSHSAVIDWEGTPAIQSTLIDITERKRAEDALRESDSRFRAFVDNSPSAILLKDSEGHYLTANRQWHEWFNPQGEEILGKTVFDMYPRPHALEVTGLDREVMSGEAAVITEVQTPFADGVERTTLFHKFPIKLDDGTVFGIGGINTDITERKQAEQALAASEDRFRILAEATPAPTVVNRISDAGFLYANQAARNAMGWSNGDLAGRTSIEMWADSGQRAEFLKELKQNGKVRDFKAQSKDADGSLRWQLISAELIDFEGEAAVFSSYIDITDVLSVEEQLRRAQKMEAVGELTGGIAHDFNNILAAIIGNLDLLQDSDNIKNDFDKEGVAIALRAALRGAELTHRLLAFSRQQDLIAQTTHINEILPHFCRLAQSTIGEDIAIDMNLAAGLWPTVVDAGQLENALLNLVINARDAMPNGGHLVIETANRVLDEDYTANCDDLVPGDYLTITVSDDGAGMPSEVRVRAFEPFFTTKEVGKGSGLGLSMVFGFAQQSGGQVSVYSEEGQGTTVRIYLPREDDTAAAQRTSEETYRDSPGGDETILVVEDDGDVRNYLVTVLRRLGYNVLEAIDGPAALEVMADAGAIDLLLTDMILPRGMNGRDVASAFHDRYPSSGVLYSSGYTREVLNRRGGFDDDATLMNKPYQTPALARRVREVLDSQA